MSKKIREVTTFTRPSIDIPFHPTESVFWFDTDPTTSESFHYHVEYYVKTGKAELVPNYPLISKDQLSITYQTLYKDVIYLEEAHSDIYYLDNNNRIGFAWRLAHNFKVTENYYIEE